MRPEVVEALVEGTAYVDLSDWRKVGVSGSAAVEWLDRLTTARVDELRPGRASPALVLDPSGSIAASLTVAVPGGSIVLVQDPSQPRSLMDLLLPHAAGDVVIDDRTDALAILSFPGRAQPPDLAGTAYSIPSCIGAGSDLFLLASDRSDLESKLARRFARAEPDEVDAWRERAGLPRFAPDGSSPESS